MSGEATPRATAGAEALERAFGAGTVCNACAAIIEDYRVVALFLHGTAVVRAYCRACYPAAVEGEYHAGGDGLLLDYPDFAARFGAPGPPPPPASPVDRLLTRLVRDPALRTLVPPNEAFARKERQVPYRFRLRLAVGTGLEGAELFLDPKGSVVSLTGDAEACRRIRATLGAP